jgi:two-component system, chemotaxis family, protein-glutamate methylesterase/glutaminase
MLGAGKLRVLVVDDSAFFRRRIQDLLSRSPWLEVAGAAGNGLEALQAVERLHPDVITMDVEMPVMDGITAVRRIMARHPTPILMFSSLTYEGARATLDALEAGAVDFLPKQLEQMGGEGGRGEDLLARRVMAVGRSRVGAPPRPPPPRVWSGPTLRRAQVGLVAIGASTGGPVALKQVLSALPGGFPIPLVLAVHMPASFTSAYAERLDQQCRIQVKEATDGDPLVPGQALLAPGGRQLLVEARGERLSARVTDGGGETYKPSVDVLLGSAARALPGRVLGIVLTGMGADGRQGARLLKAGGSHLWSQDAASCVVYGMPQAVEKEGLSDQVLPLAEIGPALGRLA